MEVGQGRAGGNGDWKRLCLGRWVHNTVVQWADEVLLSCTLETCMVLQTNVAPINSI